MTNLLMNRIGRTFCATWTKLEAGSMLCSFEMLEISQWPYPPATGKDVIDG
jgi:hypothetical protein